MDISFMIYVILANNLPYLMNVQYVGHVHLSFLVMEIIMTHGVVEKNKRLTEKNQENPVENHPDVGNRPDVVNIKKIE
jgi:hypothetical protein